MPRDLKKLRDEAQAQLEDLLRKRPEESKLASAKTRTAIGKRRTDFLGKGLTDVLSSTGSQFGIAPDLSVGAGTATAQGRIVPQLNRAVESNFGRRELEVKRDTQGKIFQEAVRLMQQHRIGLREAIAFARELATQRDTQEFIATQSEEGRQDAFKRQDLKDEFARRGILMEGDVEGGDLFQSLLRSIFGLTGAVGAGTAINRFGRPRTQPSNSSSFFQPTTFGGGGNTFRDRYNELQNASDRRIRNLNLLSRRRLPLRGQTSFSF